MNRNHVLAIAVIIIFLFLSALVWDMANPGSAILKTLFELFFVRSRGA